MLTELLWAFLIGGAICALAQFIMDMTPFSISSAHVLVTVVIVGEILGFFGIYPRLIRLAGMGAAVPLCGFGNSLAEGVISEVETNGFMGILTGGFTAGAAGLCAVIIFGFLAAVILKPKG